MSKETLKNKKWAALLSLSLLLSLTVFWAQAQTAKKPTPTPTPEKKININDTVLRRDAKNKITLKPEFEAVKQSGNSAVARKKSVGTKQQPGIGGTFDCSCTKNGGSCGLVISGNAVFCKSTSGDCGCDLQIVTK
ncbi:MAG: hypothetical protein AB7U82_11605 [Blastocatellales bacterium]